MRYCFGHRPGCGDGGGGERDTALLSHRSEGTKDLEEAGTGGDVTVETRKALWEGLRGLGKRHPSADPGDRAGEAVCLRPGGRSGISSSRPVRRPVEPESSREEGKL